MLSTRTAPGFDLRGDLRSGRGMGRGSVPGSIPDTGSRPGNVGLVADRGPAGTVPALSCSELLVRIGQGSGVAAAPTRAGIHQV